MFNVDYILFSAINGLAGNYSFLDSFMLFVSTYGLFILALLLFLTKDYKGIAEGFLAFMIASLIDMFINTFFPTNRPFVNGEVNLLVSKEPSPSFPSGHALSAFAIATSTYVHQHDKRWGLVSLVLAFLIAFSRIYVGVHYPSDVLGGIVLGTVVSYALAKSKWYLLIKK